MKDDKKINPVDEVILERKGKDAVGQEGYNFVGSIDHWTSLDEQKMKAAEIEKVTKKK